MIRFLTVSKVEQKEIKLEIGLPPSGFSRSMYFNRFRIEREEGLCLVQFGLVTTSGLLDSYSCIFPKGMLFALRAGPVSRRNVPTLPPQHCSGA
jgi:hypothetical protein